MSSSRKNKRDLTSRTVDFLNRVNSVRDNTNADPQSRNKPRVRYLPSRPINRFGSRTPQVPQGDAIWDIPSDFSEEETRPASRRRNAQTEPRSLRRSQRARTSVHVGNTPTRASRGLARVIEDRHEQSSEEDDSQMEELDKIIDKQLGGARLIQSVNENRSTDVNHGSVSEERGGQEGERDRASEEPVESISPSKKLRIQKSKTTGAQEAQEDDPEWAPDTAASEELGEEDDERGSETNRPPESTHIIQTRRLTQELASPRTTRRHTLAAPVAEKEVDESSRKPNRRSLPVQNGLRKETSTRDKQGDRTAELSEVSESVQEESESESSYEPEAEEEEEEEEAGAGRHVPDTQTEEPSITARPSKRRRTDQYQRDPQVEVVRTQPTPPAVHSYRSTPDDNESRRSSRQPSQSPAVVARPISAISGDAQNEALVRSVRDNAGNKAWFAEASNLGQQKENWDIIVTAASELRENIDPSRAESFGTIDKQLYQLRTRYTKINKRLKSQQGPLRENLRECEDLREAIFEEGNKILDSVYYLSLRKTESHELPKQAHRLVTQFEARVFPTMIKVILLVFEAYYTNRKLFPSAYRHLAGAMKLLLRFCDRTASLRTERYIRCKVHSRTIRKPLQELIKALEDNLLQRRLNETDGASRGEKKREWTEDEKIALLDGLKLFLGQDRYIRMVCHFVRRLRHRSLQELQTKAREIHDRYIPRIQEELRTVEGRRQWQWLLSVNDGQRPVSVD